MQLCECGWELVGTATIQCPRCGGKIGSGELRPKTTDFAKPNDPDQWPLWARTIARYRKPTDAGVGDTFQRMAARLGGEQIKWLATKLGMPCGCTERQAEWNRLYSYGDANAPTATDAEQR